jgi:predicted AlkP superfamily phosphohydrolase/phosphomutase
MSGESVIILGLDGATFDLVMPLVRAGKLPSFARLIQSGAKATLRSTVHPLTPSAWSSLVTGLNPGKHGVFDFRRRRPGTYRLEFANARLRDGKALWSTLSGHGKRVGVFNVPFTFPPDAVNGYMISGMDAPQGSSFTYPADLLGDLEASVGSYQIDVDSSCSEERQYAERVLSMLDKRVDALHYLLERHPDLDFLIAVFVAPDRLQHAFWKYLDPAQPAYRLAEARFFRSAVEACYGRLDELVGQLMNTLPEDATLIVASDHGFGPLYRDVHLNRWLMDKGWLRLREPISEQGSEFMKMVDWPRTKVYSFGFFGSLYLNLRGREPQGIVEPGLEEETLKKTLIRDLSQLRDPDSGKRIVDRVYRKEELYSGPHVWEAPDLVVVMEGYAYMTRDGYEGLMGPLLTPPMHYHEGIVRHSGNHRIEGLLLMGGPVIEPGMSIPRADIVDIAPTVLYLMDVPIPATMDGRVLRDALRPRRLATCPLKAPVPATGNSARPNIYEELAVRNTEVQELRQQVVRLEDEVASLRRLVRMIEQGRFLRLMSRLQAIRTAICHRITGSTGRRG